MRDVEQPQGNVPDHDEATALTSGSRLIADAVAHDQTQGEQVPGEPSPDAHAEPIAATLEGIAPPLVAPKEASPLELPESPRVPISVPQPTESTAGLGNDDTVTRALPRVEPLSHPIEDGPRDSGWASARPADVEVEPAAPEPLPIPTSEPEPEAVALEQLGAEVPRDADESVPEDPGVTDVEPIPPPGMHLRSKPPPKPAGYVSERLQVAAQPLSAPPATVTSSRPAPAPDAAFGQQLRRSKLPAVLWLLSLGVAGILGWLAAGTVNEKKLAAAQASAAAAVQNARAAAIAETKAAIPPPPAHFDLSQPAGVRSIIEVIKTEPGQRTRLEALALGRYWQDKHFEEFTRFSAELRQSPQKLDDQKTRLVALGFVGDRATSRPMLELLSELQSPRALDILYEAWIGSKDRNMTTQLAEALLLAKEVRKRASGALELALALREKPTDCGELQRLVERAIREGDRRSSNQLVMTAARQNCGPSGDKDCVMCLTDPKDMRKAIRASAARLEPVP